MRPLRASQVLHMSIFHEPSNEALSKLLTGRGGDSEPFNVLSIHFRRPLRAYQDAPQGASGAASRRPGRGALRSLF